MVTFSLIGLGLIYGLALWTIHTNTRNLEAAEARQRHRS
jgi:hypothetical protein